MSQHAPHRAVLRRFLIAATLPLGLLPALGSPAALAAGETLVQERVIGGPNRAQMYPSGLDTSPDGSVVIADTGNNQVAKYRADGMQVWRVGTTGNGIGQFENPRDIGVDSTGHVYVADTRNSRVVKLSPEGVWLAAYAGGPGDTMNFPLGISVTPDDRVLVADTGRNKVRVLDSALNPLRPAITKAANGACSIDGLRDADADEAGNYYVAGYKTNQIVTFAPDGTCRATGSWGSTGEGDGQFRTPYGVDIVRRDGRELVYVADGLNNRVQVFTTSGQFVEKFGTYGEPEAVGTFTTMRRVAVTRGDSTDVWAADLWGQRIQRWTKGQTGYAYAGTIGAILPAPTSSAVFHEPRGMAWDAQGVLTVADTVHHQLVRFHADGSYAGQCGQRAAEGSRLGQFNWPRGVAIDPVTQDLWVADTKQYKLQVLHQACATEADPADRGWTLGLGGSSSALGGFNWPYSIAIRSSDRTAWVADTQNHRVVVWDVATRTPLASYGTRGGGPGRLQFPSGIAVNPSNGRILVADSGNDRIVELDDTSGGIVEKRSLGNNSVKGLAVDGPEGVAADAAGNVFIADTGNDRLVVLGPDGTLALNGPSSFTAPANVAVGPDGKVYVADTGADRIVVHRYAAPAADTTKPTVTVTQPGTTSASSTFPAGSPVSIAGSATDDRGVTRVAVAVQDSTSKAWLTADGTFVAGFNGSRNWLDTTPSGPGQTSTQWSKAVTLPAGRYGVQSRAWDAAGNTAATLLRSLTVTAPATTDASAPDTSVTTPTVGQEFPAGTVTLSGGATDDVAVASVKVAVRDTVSSLWWNGSGWQTSFTTSPATLTAPGQQATDWSWTWAAPASGGSYAVQPVATDASGKVDPTKPWVRFTVRAS